MTRSPAASVSQPQAHFCFQLSVFVVVLDSLSVVFTKHRKREWNEISAFKGLFFKNVNGICVFVASSPNFIHFRRQLHEEKKETYCLYIKSFHVLYTTQLFFLHLSLIKKAANTQMFQALTSYVHQRSDINDLLIVACRIVVFYDFLGV